VRAETQAGAEGQAGPAAGKADRARAAGGEAARAKRQRDASTAALWTLQWDEEA